MGKLGDELLVLVERVFIHVVQDGVYQLVPE
jgi:hypothetical protein